MKNINLDYKMKIENVKTIIRDKDGLFLVGLSSYPSPSPVFSLLGGHSEKGETAFETLGREIMEESSLVLELDYDENKGFFLKPSRNINLIPLRFDGISIVEKKWYVFFEVDQSLQPTMSIWKNMFHKNQKKIKQDAIDALKEIDSHLKWSSILDLFLQRKFIEVKEQLATRLTKAEIQQVIAYMKDVGYYLENKDILLVPLEELKKNIYETDVLKYL